MNPTLITSEMSVNFSRSTGWGNGGLAGPAGGNGYLPIYEFAIRVNNLTLFPGNFFYSSNKILFHSFVIDQQAINKTRVTKYEIVARDQFTNLTWNVLSTFCVSSGIYW